MKEAIKIAIYGNNIREWKRVDENTKKKKKLGSENQNQRKPRNPVDWWVKECDRVI